MFRFVFDYTPPLLVKIIGHVTGIFMVLMSSFTVFLAVSLFRNPVFEMFILLAISIGLATFLGVAAIKLLRSEEREERLFPSWVYRLLQIVFTLAGVVGIAMLWRHFESVGDFEFIEFTAGIFCFFYLSLLCYQAAED